MFVTWCCIRWRMRCLKIFCCCSPFVLFFFCSIAVRQKDLLKHNQKIRGCFGGRALLEKLTVERSNYPRKLFISVMSVFYHTVWYTPHTHMLATPWGKVSSLTTYRNMAQLGGGVDWYANEHTHGRAIWGWSSSTQHWVRCGTAHKVFGVKKNHCLK